MQNPPFPNVIAIIQARMAAQRLPGKMLMDLEGQPLLVRTVERTRRAERLTGYLVATTTDPTDDAIVSLCQSRGYPCFRGDPYDVLDRYWQAAESSSADVIVRITGDCPVIDPMLIDALLHTFFQQGDLDFATNRLIDNRTFPIGLDIEVCTRSALQVAWQLADKAHQREHVMPFIYEETDRFQILQVHHEEDLGHYRWTVDTQKDLELLREIYRQFDGRDDFTWLEIVSLMDQKPALVQINASVGRKGLEDIDQRAQEQG